MALFNADSYQEVCKVDRLTVNFTKYDITEGGQAMLLTRDHGRGASDRFIAYVEHKLTLSRPDETREKNTNKGYN